MFERYTEKARRVIFVSRYEASQFGSPYIEADFILLGILHEDPGIVTRWLDPINNWQVAFRKKIEEHCAFREKIPTSVDLPLSNESKRVLEYAAEEMEQLKQSSIDIEHLLLGILRERDSHAARMLRDVGIDETRVREALIKEGVKSAPARTGSVLPLHHMQASLAIEGRDSLIPFRLPPRIPVAGELLNLNLFGKPGMYQVTKIEWQGSVEEANPLILHHIVVHARQAPKN